MLRYTYLLTDEFSGWQRVLVAYIAIPLLALTMIIKRRQFGQHYRWLMKYLIPYTCVILFSMAYTWVLYRYSIESILIASSPFIYILFSFPLIYIFCCDGSCITFLKTIASLQVLILIIKAVAWYFYNFTSINLFENLVMEFGVWMRNGLQRVEQGQLFGITLCVFTYLAIRKNFKLKYFAVSVGMVCFVLLVSMARFSVAVSVITVAAILYFAKRKGQMKVWMRLFVVAAAVTLLISGVFAELVDSALITGQYAASTTARLNNLNYFVKILHEQNRIFGLGFLDTSNEAARYVLFYSHNNRFYLDDIGIFGGVVRFGILSLVIYGWLFFLTIRTCLNCYKRKNNQYFPFMVGLTVFMITSCLLQNIFDIQRAYSIPFYLATVSYIDTEISKNADPG